MGTEETLEKHEENVQSLRERIPLNSAGKIIGHLLHLVNLEDQLIKLKEKKIIESKMKDLVF